MTDRATTSTSTSSTSNHATAAPGRKQRTESRRELRLLRRNYAMPIRWGVERLGWGVKVCWVLAHTFCVGFILVVDSDLRRQTLDLSWIAASYYVLLILTVVQYYYTAGSSPGYVRQAMQEDESFEEHAKSSLDSSSLSTSTSLGRSYSSVRAVTNGGAPEVAHNGQSVQISISETTPLLAPSSGSQSQGKSASKVKFCNDAVLISQPSCFPTEPSPVGRCHYCHVIQPFRTKHCHDCDRCVLRFDHHCVWLGTCVGQSNHHKFWWYVFFETLLVLWTAKIYGSAMTTKDSENWLLHDTIVLTILLGLIACLAFLVTLLLFHTYLAVTNQTTYEKTRRRRIAYLRNLPDNVHPFSKGCSRNVQSFCCTPSGTYPIYNLPTQEEIDTAKARGCCG